MSREQPPREPPPLPQKHSPWAPGRWITDSGAPDDARYETITRCITATTAAIWAMLWNGKNYPNKYKKEK